MQEEFKERILSYLVGDITPETQPANYPKIEETEIFNVDLSSYASQNNLVFFGNMMSQNGILVTYGRIGTTSNGFILLTDKYYNIIKLFTTYEGGTTLPKFVDMKQDETGNFYATTEEYSDNQYTGRLILLNNFTLTLTDTYSLKYRQGYTYSQNMLDMMNNGHSDGATWKTLKKPGESKYLFVSNTLENYGSGLWSTYVDMATIQINVGSENEWTYVRSNSYERPVNISDLYYDWYEDNYRVKYGYDYVPTEPIYDTKYHEIKWTNGTQISSIEHVWEAARHFSASDITMKNYDETYICGRSNNDDCIFKFETGGDDNYSLIYGEPYLAIGNRLHLTSQNNIVIASGSDNSKMHFYFINDRDVNEMGNIATTTDYVSSLVSNLYNLYTITCYPYQWTIQSESTNLIEYKFIYNPNNYNGEDFLNLQSTIPNSGILYDDNDKLIYARNLYNVSINQNTSESTLEIPNIYLNDSVINTEELRSKTNSILNINEEAITKNIYESLYINFFNTLNMKNANDPNNVIINIPGASRLNGSISGYNSYSNVKIGNIRITYSDNTYLDIDGFNLTKNSDTNYTIDFELYVGKAISNIKIMSTDKMTTYQTITPTLEVGKAYNISQDVKII